MMKIIHISSFALTVNWNFICFDFPSIQSVVLFFHLFNLSMLFRIHISVQIQILNIKHDTATDDNKTNNNENEDVIAFGKVLICFVFNLFNLLMLFRIHISSRRKFKCWTSNMILLLQMTNKTIMTKMSVRWCIWKRFKIK